MMLPVDSLGDPFSYLAGEHLVKWPEFSLLERLDELGKTKSPVVLL